MNDPSTRALKIDATILAEHCDQDSCSIAMYKYEASRALYDISLQSCESSSLKLRDACREIKTSEEAVESSSRTLMNHVNTVLERRCNMLLHDRERTIEVDRFNHLEILKRVRESPTRSVTTRILSYITQWMEKK